LQPPPIISAPPAGLSGVVTLDCAQFAEPRVEVIDYIARLKLGLRRGNGELRLSRVSRELAGLIELAGLADLLGVQVQGQAEQRKQPGGVEKERDLADPPT
jgi:hypothetical protein